MKKLLFLLICLCVVLSGCGNPDLWTDSFKDKIPKTTYATDDNGNTTMTEKSGDTTIAGNLPCAIKYNGKNVYLKSVDFYEHYDDGGTYSYFLYCVVTFDVSELDNADVHWLQKEDADVYALQFRPADRAVHRRAAPGADSLLQAPQLPGRRHLCCRCSPKRRSGGNFGRR